MSPQQTPDLDRESDAYRRRIRVTAVDTNVVLSELEDDFHCFVVTLGHDGARVESVHCASVRWPWSTCPAAAARLQELVGMPLSRRFTAAGSTTDPKHACMHQFDATCYAITHAARGSGQRVYDVEVPKRDPTSGVTHGRLWVDGELRLAWNVNWNGILDAEPPFDAAPWRGGFVRWADETLPEELAESAITLRRACDIGIGRGIDFDAVSVAQDLPSTIAGSCHTMQPELIGVALRNVGSVRDFAHMPERLLAETRDP